MAPQDVLLRHICAKEETYKAAKALLRTAQAKTGPGSGHEVGAHSTGLPAICAYIASQELCNNDISEVVAQTASCLKPKDFKKTLNIVRSVLTESGARQDRNNSPTKSPSKPAPSLASQKSSPSKTPRRKRNDTSANSISKDDDSSPIPESPTKKRKLMAKMAKKPKYLFSSTPTDSSPSHDPLEALKKDFKGRLEPETGTAVVVDTSPVTTPSKPGPSTPPHHKSHSAEIAVEDDGGMQVDAPSTEKRTNGETTRHRRFRRVFLDQKQWLGRDPRLVLEWEQAEAHKKGMMALYGHPFERYRPQVKI